ncbi:transcriptional antiterminator, partial [Streptomyces ardesiacus]
VAGGARAVPALGAALPESEINFLGMHLAALAQHSRT